jgi:hypothetical protein
MSALHHHLGEMDATKDLQADPTSGKMSTLVGKKSFRKL